MKLPTQLAVCCVCAGEAGNLHGKEQEHGLHIYMRQLTQGLHGRSRT